MPRSSSVEQQPKSDQIVLRTGDGGPPVLPGKERQEIMVGGFGGWKKVNSLDEVENIYDNGFWRNLLDIFYV